MAITISWPIIIISIEPLVMTNVFANSIFGRPNYALARLKIQYLFEKVSN